MQILLIGRESLDKEHLNQVLTAAGHEMTFIQDLAPGLEHHLNQTYDLILLDAIPPSLAGISIARRLRTAHVSLPILMFSSQDRAEDRILGLNSGADDYLTLPVHTCELLFRVRSLTRRAQSTAPESCPPVPPDPTAL